MSNNNETILNNRYRLVAQQGSGGMAVIYKAVDLELGRTVAVKILRPSLTSDPSFLTRFRNEARSVANMNHPNIVTVFDVGNEAQTYYIVMEFIDGQDLKKIIKTEGVLPVDRAVKLAIQICAGIGFAHRAGLVHADVKPQNILVTKDGTVKVTDFGIAQAFTNNQPGERVSVVWGSPHYFAPEQARGERPSPASDVYAIGIVLFEMLTGRLPYVGSNQQELALAHIRERIPLVTEFNPAVPDTLAQIVAKVMSKDPSARYRTADQLGHVLESYRDRGRDVTLNSPAQGQPVAPSPVPTVYTPPPQQPPTLPQAPVVAQPPQPQVPQPQGLPFTAQQPPPQYVQPPSPLPFTQQGQAAQIDPTRQYNAAPEAPKPYNYAQAGRGQPPQQAQGGFAPPPAQGFPPATAQLTNSQPLYPPREAIGQAPSLDIITVALAVLAFFAVLCLIPLWIQVYLARFAGG